MKQGPKNYHENVQFMFIRNFIRIVLSFVASLVKRVVSAGMAPRLLYTDKE